MYEKAEIIKTTTNFVLFVDRGVYMLKSKHLTIWVSNNPTIEYLCYVCWAMDYLEKLHKGTMIGYLDGHTRVVYNNPLISTVSMQIDINDLKKTVYWMEHMRKHLFDDFVLAAKTVPDASHPRVMQLAYELKSGKEIRMGNLVIQGEHNHIDIRISYKNKAFVGRMNSTPYTRAYIYNLIHSPFIELFTKGEWIVGSVIFGLILKSNQLILTVNGAACPYRVYLHSFINEVYRQIKKYVFHI